MAHERVPASFWKQLNHVMNQHSDEPETSALFSFSGSNTMSPTSQYICLVVL